MHTIKIEGNGMPKHTRVYIDGTEVRVTHVDISMAVDRVPEVTLKIPAYLDVPDDLLAVIDAIEASRPKSEGLK